ncbi:triose-phosphate isomerase [Candidatus Saccharibacteria bacterium]|nr:triose-phosphate isomerase [Candidatus Saccharibacteria bacterium]
MARLIVANWKMNLDPAAAIKLVTKLEPKIDPSERVEVVILPPSIDLYPLDETIDKTKLKLGAQNIHYLDEGPFTGEVSAAMLKGVIDYALIGHSERRAMGEDDKLIAKKVAAAYRNGITSIVCIGENLDQREHKLSSKVVVDQLTADLALVTAEEVKDIVIAYEPLWAISHGDGKGRHATPDDIRAVLRAIRSTVEDLYGEAGGVGMRLLYGGSVNADDCMAYLGMDEIDGLLVGGDSLNYEDFASIIDASDRENTD